MITQLVLAAARDVNDILGALPSIVDDAEHARSSAVTAAVEFNDAITDELRSTWGDTADVTAAHATTMRLNYAHKVRQLRRAIRRLEVVLDGAERMLEENDGQTRPENGEPPAAELPASTDEVLKAAFAAQNEQSARDRNAA